MKPLLFLVLGFGASLSQLSAEVSPGELFISEMNCAACHAVSPQLATRLSSRAAPKLAKDGVPMSPQWIREFLANPQKAKPGTLMPDLLHGIPDEKKADTVEALTHFLVSIQPDEKPQPQQKSARSIEMGRKLYHEIGCVQCHAPEVLPPNRAKDEESASALEALKQASVPLGNPARKFTRAGLADFLRDPLRSRPSGRMPAMQLTSDEADAIAAYLLREQAPGDGGIFSLDREKSQAGAKMFISLRCADCHSDAGAGIAVEARPAPARPLAEMRSRQPSGCVSSKPKAEAPKFELTDRQRAVILVALQSQDVLALPLTGEQQIKRTMTVLNCYACHSRERRGGAEGLRREYLTSHGGNGQKDEDRIPPTLTGIGSRLTPDRLRDALLNGTRTRPSMATRMPVYGEANVKHLLPLLENVPK